MTISKNIREIVLDTETTGLDSSKGDRIVDIGCVELIDHIQTGKFYHVYINPERPMSVESVRVTGITDEFLQDKPIFSEIVDEFLDFVKDSTLVIHNAKFDIDFLNSELNRVGKPLFKLEEAVDTLTLAKRKFPNSPASLDALCRRFNVDTTIRETHGALVDCYLLAEVYINLLGGYQGGLSFDEESSSTEKNINEQPSHVRHESNFHQLRNFLPNPEEIAVHEEFLKTLNESKWNLFLKK